MRYIAAATGLLIVGLLILACRPLREEHQEAVAPPDHKVQLVGPAVVAPASAPTPINGPDRPEPTTAPPSVPPPAPSTSAAVQPHGRVVIVGDSLTVGSKGAIVAGLAGAAPDITAVTGMGIRWGAGVLAGADLDGVDLVVVALGTNDYLASPREAGRLIDATMSEVGALEVLWVNIDTGGALDEAVGVNSALRDAASRYDHLTVADWNSHVRSSGVSRQRAGDGIHYDPGGYRERGRWLAEEIKVALGR